MNSTVTPASAGTITHRLLLPVPQKMFKSFTSFFSLDASISEKRAMTYCTICASSRKKSHFGIIFETLTSVINVKK